MKLATERFWQALLRDPDYYPAELNLVCLEHLSGRTGTASYTPSMPYRRSQCPWMRGESE